MIKTTVKGNQGMDVYPAKTRYRGKTAVKYNAERSSSAKWKREFEALEEVISHFQPGTSVLDIPVGTGRFLPLFLKEGNHTVYGMDISEDMLAQAQTVSKEDGHLADLRVGDIEDIPLAGSSIDYVVCMRLLNWVPLHILKRMVQECQRVAKELVVLEIRVRKPASIGELILKGAKDFFAVRPWTSKIYEFAVKFKNLLSFLRSNESARYRGALGYTVHREADIEKILDELGLARVERHFIDSKTSYGKREVQPYYLYVLKSA